MEKKFSLVEFDKLYKEETKKLIKEILKKYGFIIDKNREKLINDFVEKNYPLESKHYEEIIDKILESYKNKVFYVWFDAPIGYLTNTIYASEGLNFNDSLNEALKKIKGEWKKWFASDDTKIIHFIGKDNIPFHTNFWPGMIIGFNHGFVENIEWKEIEFLPNEKKFQESLSEKNITKGFQKFLIEKLSKEDRELFFKYKDNPKKVKELLKEKINLKEALNEFLEGYFEIIEIENELLIKLKKDMNFIIQTVRLALEGIEDSIYLINSDILDLQENTLFFDFLAYLFDKKVKFKYIKNIKLKQGYLVFNKKIFEPDEEKCKKALKESNFLNDFYDFFKNIIRNEDIEEFCRKREDIEKMRTLLKKYNIDIIEELKKWFELKKINALIKEKNNELIIEELSEKSKNKESDYISISERISYFSNLFNFLAYLLNKKIVLIYPQKKISDNKILDTALNLPYNVVGYNYLNYEGQKFSKSKGVGIFLNNLELLSLIPVDAWRFYLISILPEQKDSDFSWKDFEEKYNKELLGNFANFVFRVLSFAKKNNLVEAEEVFDELIEKRNKLIFEFEQKMKIENVKLKEALQLALKLSDLGNKEFQKFEPWKKIKENKEETKKFIVTMLNYVYSLAYLIYPFMPKTAEKIAKMLNIKIKDFEEPYKVKKRFELREIEHLFEKIDFKLIKIVFELKNIDKDNKILEKFLSVLNENLQTFTDEYLKKSKLYDQLLTLKGDLVKKEFSNLKVLLKVLSLLNQAGKLKDSFTLELILSSIPENKEKCCNLDIYFEKDEIKIIGKFDESNEKFLNTLVKVIENYTVKILNTKKLEKNSYFKIVFDHDKKSKETCFELIKILEPFISSVENEEKSVELLKTIKKWDETKNEKLLKVLELIFSKCGKEKLSIKLEKNKIILENPDIKTKNNLQEIEELVQFFNELLKNYKIIVKKEKMEEGLISIDDFLKVKLRVGKIIKVEEPKELKKLYKLTVAFDKEGKETKTILAGLKNYFKPEELQNKIVVVVYNLKPKKVAGYESQGMLLAAEKDGKLDLVTVNNEDLIGAYLS
jgi:methionine--tRNA ligase beta chain